MSVAAFAAVVHITANFEYFSDAVRRQMRAAFHERDNLLELCKVSFLLGREKRESFKERNHVLDDSVEVRHLVIPNAIGSAAKSAAA